MKIPHSNLYHNSLFRLRVRWKVDVSGKPLPNDAPTKPITSWEQEVRHTTANFAYVDHSFAYNRLMDCIMKERKWYFPDGTPRFKYLLMYEKIFDSKILEIPDGCMKWDEDKGTAVNKNLRACLLTEPLFERQANGEIWATGLQRYDTQTKQSNTFYPRRELEKHIKEHKEFWLQQAPKRQKERQERKVAEYDQPVGVALDKIIPKIISTEKPLHAYTDAELENYLKLRKEVAA